MFSVLTLDFSLFLYHIFLPNFRRGTSTYVWSNHHQARHSFTFNIFLVIFNVYINGAYQVKTTIAVQTMETRISDVGSGSKG
jgi:hypothetical protein